MSLISAPGLPLDGLAFTMISYEDHIISQQAGSTSLNVTMNDTIAGDVLVPAFQAACGWYYGPHTYDDITGERYPDIVECTVSTPNPYHSIVTVDTGAGEISYYFYSREKYVICLIKVELVNGQLH